MKIYLIFRKTLIIIIAIFFVLSFSGKVNSYFFKIVNRNTPTTYKVKVRNLYVSSDGGQTWIKILDEPTEFNIAKEAKNLMSNNPVINSLPAGSYDKIKYSLCATFKMKGYVTYNRMTYYTSTVAENGTGVTEEFNLSNPPSDYGEADITLFGYIQGEYLEPQQENIEVMIDENSNRNIHISVDITNTLALYQTRADPYTYQLMPGEPTITILLK